MRQLFLSILIVSVLNACKNTPGETDQKSASKLVPIATPTDSVSAEPYLFTSKSGLVYLSWIKKDSQQSTLKYSVLQDSNWSQPSIIASGENWFVNWADFPALATDNDDNLVAHFLEKSEKGTYTYDIKLITSANSGNNWTSPVILNDDGKKAEHGFVSIVPYKGDYFISWLDGRKTGTADSEHGGDHHGQMTLRAAIVDKSGKKIQEWELDDRVCDCCQTSAAITASGPIVVYRDRSLEEIRDIFIVRLVDGRWTKPEVVAPDNWKIDGCPVNGPQVAAEGSNVAVAWFSSPEKNAQVKVAFSTDGGSTFSKAIRVDEGKALGRVDLVMLDSATAIVSWLEGVQIKAAKFSADGTKSQSQVVATSSESRSAGFPQMTRSGKNLVFAWTDGKNKTIQTAMAPSESF